MKKIMLIVSILFLTCSNMFAQVRSSGTKEKLFILDTNFQITKMDYVLKDALEYLAPEEADSSKPSDSIAEFQIYVNHYDRWLKTCNARKTTWDNAAAKTLWDTNKPLVKQEEAKWATLYESGISLLRSIKEQVSAKHNDRKTLSSPSSTFSKTYKKRKKKVNLKFDINIKKERKKENRVNSNSGNKLSSTQQYLMYKNTMRTECYIKALKEAAKFMNRAGLNRQTSDFTIQQVQVQVQVGEQNGKFYLQGIWDGYSQKYSGTIHRLAHYSKKTNSPTEIPCIHRSRSFQKEWIVFLFTDTHRVNGTNFFHSSEFNTRAYSQRKKLVAFMITLKPKTTNNR